MSNHQDRSGRDWPAQREFMAAKRLRFSSFVVKRTLEVMDRSGMSYSAIAWKAGCSPATLYAWDRGKTRRPNLDTIWAVLRACGRGLDALEK